MPEANQTVPTPARRLRGLALAYAAFTLTTVPFSLAYRVGASAEGNPTSDMPLRGTGFTPPLFLPLALVVGARIARSPKRHAVGGAALVSLVSIAILGGSTLNVPNDVVAVRAAGGPEHVTYVLASISGVLALALVGHGLAAVVALRRGDSGEVSRDGEGRSTLAAAPASRAS
jgi:hypothetical protein